MQAKKNIRLATLRCYIKNKDAYTILTPCNNPTTVYKNPPDVEEFLPSTDKIQWKWRQKKEKAFALRNPTQEIEEFPALTTNKKISTKSTARRKDILIEIEEQKKKKKIHKYGKILQKIF